jgi:MinD-like ATPase involved in chromosome partitioning or flagellar assembly
VNEHGLVAVPENAIREELIAFGLTAPQLGLLGGAVVVGAVLNLLPLPVPIRLLLALLGAGPIVVAAILPVRGEPAYRWLVRAVRHVRGPRVWQATLGVPDKSQVSGPADARGSQDGAVMRQATQPSVLPGGSFEADDERGHSSRPGQGPGTDDESAASEAPRVLEPAPMQIGAARLKLLRPSDAGSGDPGPAAPDREELERPLAIPHVLAGLRVVGVLSFAGGVGKTTLAAEVATRIGSRARYRTIDGDEQPLGVLLLDASRTSPACALRLGLDPEPVSRSRAPRTWTQPGALEAARETSRWGTDLVTLAPHPLVAGRDAADFRARDAEAILDEAQRAGYQLLVADLGTVHEEGHRHLIDQASLVLAVVRPTIESLPDLLRIAEYVRTLAMGRKLAVVGNMADDDATIRRLAAEADVPIVALIPSTPGVVTAGDRGEPAWYTDPAFAQALQPVASAVWPLMAGSRGRGRDPVRGMASAVRRALGQVVGSRS